MKDHNGVYACLSTFFGCDYPFKSKEKEKYSLDKFLSFYSEESISISRKFIIDSRKRNSSAIKI